MIEEAAAFAERVHRGTFRKGTSIPYIVHPMETAVIVSGFTGDEEMIAAALLHVPAAAVATAIPGAERASRTSSPPRRENAELRTRVPRAVLHKIDRAIQQSHKYIDRRDWMMQSVRQLLTEEGLL